MTQEPWTLEDAESGSSPQEEPRRRFRDWFVALVVFHTVLDIILGCLWYTVRLNGLLVGNVIAFGIITAQVALAAAVGSLTRLAFSVRVPWAFFLAGLIWLSLALGAQGHVSRAEASIIGLWIAILLIVMLGLLQIARNIAGWHLVIGDRRPASGNRPLTLRHLLAGMTLLAMELAAIRAVLPAATPDFDAWALTALVLFLVFGGVPAVVAAAMVGWAMREPFAKAVERGICYTAVATAIEMIMVGTLEGSVWGELVIWTAGAHAVQLLVIYGTLGLLRRAGLRMLYELAEYWTYVETPDK